MQTISIPTTVGSSSATLIDNIFAHNDVLLKIAGVVLCNVSDHYAVFDVEMECKLDESYIDIEKRIMNKPNMNSLSIAIRSYNWESIKMRIQLKMVIMFSVTN